MTTLLFLALAAPHGGGVNSLGCHHDRKRGGYHCHRGPLAGRSFSSQTEARRELEKRNQPPKKKPKPKKRSER